MKQTLRFRGFGFFLIVAFLSIFAPIFSFAAEVNDLALSAGSVKFSTATFLEGKPVRIYASVKSIGAADLRGVVRFFDGQNQIQGDQPVSIIAGKEDAVFVDWVPQNHGEHAVRITVSMFEKTDSNLANNSYSKTLSVLADTDRDGKPNVSDTDDDNDTVNDDADKFPLNKNESKDSDGDGIGDNKDDNDDNDNAKDSEDELPLDPGETKDSDKDGTGDNQDTDDDGDGIADVDEIKKGTDPVKKDTDGDLVPDNLDAYPTDSSEAYDYDQDGISDHKDTDADNDGISKEYDADDTNLGPVIKVTSGGRSPVRFVSPGEPVKFESTKSTDPDGAVAKTVWQVGDKNFESGEMQTSFSELGAHKISVRVTDNKGESRETFFRIFVIPPYLPWIIIPAVLLLIILAMFYVFSYSKPRRSRFERVIDTLETINKAIPKAKRKKRKKSKLS